LAYPASKMNPNDDIRNLVLPHYAEVSPAARAQRFGTGLINQTYLVEDGTGGTARRFVLQRVNPIFPITIHDNIEAVTAHLESHGVFTPRLIRTRESKLCLDLGPAGIWRLFNHVEGTSFDVIDTVAQAHAAGAMVGRFHRALDDFQLPFTGLRLGVHDTPKHLLRLGEAIATLREHRLHPEVRRLGDAILAGAERLPPLPRMPDRMSHGDLKFNNILFAGNIGHAAEQPVCLIDLDTVGPLALAFELGDAWRSWCNRNGENNPVAALDLDIFRASLAGYREGLGRALTEPERMALLLGLDWVSLELSARFAADALFESYFGWDSEQFTGRGEHNLVRAQGQWSLHQALLASRAERAALLELPAI
jgi:Ser/Thr protein kinase RdoA (MazF antagonist)